MHRVFAVREGSRNLEWLAASQAAELAAQGRLACPLDGTVYGVALNSRRHLQRLGAGLEQAPYAKPPVAPVLYIKPVNTFNRSGGVVEIPADVESLEANATLAVVFERTVANAAAADVAGAIRGYAIALDICVPHENLHRPAITARCRDGFLPVGPWIAPLADPDAAEIVTTVNGAEAARWSLADLKRPVFELVAEISRFMTFAAGDALLVGLNPEPAFVRAGDVVTASVEGLGALEVTLQGEAQ
ncbi:fumarylacetoacetate hydrolase family protein [Caulobacter sp.]|uniref:fumarylacetoacetate hydrolase family protein n=1 Tax=Caulobacter sp. TaxID=78 RepID=UPI0031D0946B